MSSFCFRNNEKGLKNMNSYVDTLRMQFVGSDEFSFINSLIWILIKFKKNIEFVFSKIKRKKQLLKWIFLSFKKVDHKKITIPFL